MMSKALAAQYLLSLFLQSSVDFLICFTALKSCLRVSLRSIVHITGAAIVPMAAGSFTFFGHFWATSPADAARPATCFESLPASKPHFLFAVCRPWHLSTAFKMTLIMPLVAFTA